ncbi:MAG: tetratricopeptide repeat protein [Anaerolineae bacterium]|nr:tetratricopeptide repeat protein [Anaerolineae bacterium]
MIHHLGYSSFTGVLGALFNMLTSLGVPFFNRPLVSWLRQRVHWLFDVLPDAAKPSTHYAAKAQAALGRARRCLAQDDLDAALSLASIAIEDYERAADREGASQAQVVLAEALRRIGQDDLAIAAYERSLPDLKQPNVKAQTLTTVADLYAAGYRYTEARDSYRLALKVYHNLGHRTREAYVAHRLAYVLYEQERWPEAEKLYRQAWQLAEELNLQSVKGSLLLEIGNSIAQQGRRVEARQWFERSIAQTQMSGDILAQAEALHSLAAVCQADREAERARAFYPTILRHLAAVLAHLVIFNGARYTK